MNRTRPNSLNSRVFFAHDGRMNRIMAIKQIRTLQQMTDFMMNAGPAKIRPVSEGHATTAAMQFASSSGFKPAWYQLFQPAFSQTFGLLSLHGLFWDCLFCLPENHPP